jgi:subtilisin-like proprotein convertase family protein
MRKTGLLLVLGTILVLPGCGDDKTAPNPVAPAAPPPAPPPATETTVVVNSRDVPKGIANNGRTNSTLSFTTAGTILEVSVEVNITHTWRGDLDVRLLHPDGTLADLFIGNPVDSTDNVINTFTVANAPTLARIVSKPSAGTWTLQIDDTQPQDKGDLNSWSLRLRIRQ